MKISDQIRQYKNPLFATHENMEQLIQLAKTMGLTGSNALTIVAMAMNTSIELVAKSFDEIIKEEA